MTTSLNVTEQDKDDNYKSSKMRQNGSGYLECALVKQVMVAVTAGQRVITFPSRAGFEVVIDNQAVGAATRRLPNQRPTLLQRKAREGRATSGRVILRSAANAVSGISGRRLFAGTGRRSFLDLVGGWLGRADPELGEKLVSLFLPIGSGA